MRSLLTRLRAPMYWAGLVAWLAVVLSFRFLPDGQGRLAGGLAVAWLLTFLSQPDAGPMPSWRVGLRGLLQAALALVLVAVAPGIGTAQVLLVVGAAQLAMHSVTGALLVALVADVAFYLIVRDAGVRSPLLVATINFAFQAFAMLCAHYARSAERSRDALARVNADLLATRALLADSARDAERLRMARDLHDVAGHTLTALTLNLRLLAADPVLASREELRTAQRLAGDLMTELRGVVQALRAAPGLDLETALRALAAPLPRPALDLAIDPRVRVDDPAVAEALLRLVQEALTNAARHADAARLSVRIAPDGDALAVHVEDDGRVHGAIREGSGLSGMRERIAAVGGRMELARSARGGLAIDARLPA